MITQPLTPTLLFGNMVHNTTTLSILATTPNYINTTTSVPHRVVKACVIDDWKTVTILVSFALVLVIGVVGNISILSVFVPRLDKKNKFELLIVYLAVCDFFASIFGPGVFIYWKATCGMRWDFGYIGCKILPAMSRITVDISIGVVLIMTIDRCRSIMTPLKRRLTSTNIHLSVLLCVVLCVLCEYYYIHAIHVTELGICGVPMVSRLEFSIPLVVMTTLRDASFVIIFTLTTLLVSLKLMRKSNQALLGNFSKKRQTSNLRVLKMLVAMAIIFGLLVIPRDVLHLTFTVSWMNWPRKTGIMPT